MEISNSETKTIYNTDKVFSGKEWLGESKNGDVIYPKLKTALSVSNDGKIRKMSKESLGFFANMSNNVYENTQKVILFSVFYSHDGTSGVEINKDNIFRVTSLFTARKVIKGDWINQKDEYLAPNEEHEQFEQFKYDSLIYSLFNSASNQSSLRQVTYKDKLWDIKNEFFWMSVEEMKQLADDNGYDNLYNDARTSPNRHVYNLLFGEDRIYDKLSPDAKLVLDKASELVRKSIQARQLMSDNENHLDSWDAGYAQLKLVWKEYFSEDFKEFRQMYKNLEDRMRPLVYELGFLMK